MYLCAVAWGGAIGWGGKLDGVGHGRMASGSVADLEAAATKKIV